MPKTVRWREHWPQEFRNEDGGVTMTSCPWGFSQFLLSLEQKSRLWNSSCVWERPRILMRNSRSALVGQYHHIAWEFHVIFADNNKKKTWNVLVGSLEILGLASMGHQHTPRLDVAWLCEGNWFGGMVLRGTREPCVLHKLSHNLQANGSCVHLLPA